MLPEATNPLSGIRINPGPGSNSSIIDVLDRVFLIGNCQHGGFSDGHNLWEPDQRKGVSWQAFEDQGSHYHVVPTMRGDRGNPVSYRDSGHPREFAAQRLFCPALLPAPCCLAARGTQPVVQCDEECLILGSCGMPQTPQPVSASNQHVPQSDVSAAMLERPYTSRRVCQMALSNFSSRENFPIPTKRYPEWMNWPNQRSVSTLLETSVRELQI